MEGGARPAGGSELRFYFVPMRFFCPEFGFLICADVVFFVPRVFFCPVCRFLFCPECLFFLSPRVCLFCPVFVFFVPVRFFCPATVG